MPRVLIQICFAFGLLAACTDFPDLDRVISEDSRRADFPSLIAIDPLLMTAQSDSERADTIAKSLIARAANLKRRARALRGPVIERRIRVKMINAMRRNSQ